MDADTIIDTVLALDPLSELPRTGWLLRGIQPCESIAEHSFGVGVLTMLLVDALRAEGHTVDGEVALRMALLHDAAEAKTGDVPMPSKTPALRAALKEQERAIVRALLPEALATTVEQAEEGTTLEARIVKAADKLQMMIKVLRYQQTKRGQLDEFWVNPKNLRDQDVPGVRELFDAIFRRGGRTRPDE